MAQANASAPVRNDGDLCIMRIGLQIIGEWVVDSPDGCVCAGQIVAAGVGHASVRSYVRRHPYDNYDAACLHIHQRRLRGLKKCRLA
jgi:hypothetical protein